MNKSERLMSERMNFVSRRGRTAEYQKNEWLRNLRAERRKYDGPLFTVFCHHLGWMNVSGTLNAAKIVAKSIEREVSDVRIWIVDARTRIQVWENYSTN